MLLLSFNTIQVSPDLVHEHRFVQLIVEQFGR